MTNDNRVPAGSPEGGQFAKGSSLETDGLSLSNADDAAAGFYGEIKDRDQRTERMKDDLHHAVFDIINSGEMRSYLEARRLNRASSWSMSNRILAACQLAERDGDSSVENVIDHLGRLDCGSFKQWKERGRNPVKGSKALYILAPVTRSITEDDPEHPGQERKRTIMVGVKPMATFDVSQTEGDPVPQHPAVRPFNGEVEPGTAEAIRGRYEELGYTYEEMEIEGTDPKTLSGRLAYVSPSTKKVVVDSRLSETQKSQALAHELGHIELGHTSDDETRDYGNRVHRGEMETEAEAFGYMMMRERGADPQDAEAFSPAYIAGWSGGDSKMVTKALDRAGKAFDQSREAIWPSA